MPALSNKSHVSAVILGMVLLVVMGMLSRQTSVSAQTPSATQAATQAATQEPVQPCAECHLKNVSDWQNSPHAQAYHDVAFQAAWEQKGRDVQCLACHTTGFVARTGEYAALGVTCEACHGQTPPKHPPEPVLIQSGIDMCADCHANTVAEWKKSAHGTQQLACTTCHVPHTQKLRFESSDLLCLNCHKEALTDYAHVSHPKQQCVDCHWYRSAEEAKHITTGNLLPTGHDNAVTTRTCVDCHATLARSGSVVALSTPPATASPLQETVRAEELEARVKTVQAQAENNALLRTTEGVALGAVIGGVLMAGLVGLRNRRGPHNPGR
jgi:hypothetical protein